MPERQTLVGNQTLLAPLAAQRPTDVPGVVTALRELRDTADHLGGTGDRHRDGIACFSDLYLTITQDVLAEYERGAMFHCGEFILQLDIAFARRYLVALDDHLHGRPSAPGCWEVLFTRRQEDHEEWQFAVVGVNAHVNFDLAFALLDVWEDNPTPLATTSAQYADYEAINTIFRNNMDALCEKNEVPWTKWGPDGGIIDGLGNLVGNILVSGTRDVAWTFAEHMWARRTADPEHYRVAPTAALDRIATGVAEAFL
ncbi:DUF5995 family protein [Actinomycetospora flava]|uniref:DUF5995 family protein n=1 Tax=Actinomycetospora flava TaxID=3129232 RepID=A0ABU8LXV8_9PSEU